MTATEKAEVIREFMTGIARLGGATITRRKSAQARANGRKGGRPKGSRNKSTTAQEVA
jgi:hypothetical protein